MAYKRQKSLAHKRKKAAAHKRQKTRASFYVMLVLFVAVVGAVGIRSSGFDFSRESFLNVFESLGITPEGQIRHSALSGKSGQGSGSSAEEGSGPGSDAAEGSGSGSSQGSEQDINTGRLVSEITLDSSEHSLICVHEGEIVKCMPDIVCGIDTDGSQKWMVPIRMSEPFIKISDAGMLIADSKGTSACLIDDGRMKWEITADEPIINADISDSGYAAIVQEAAGYKCRVSVFDPSGMEIFNRCFVERYVLQAIPAPSNGFVAVSGVDATGLISVSSLEYFDMFGEPYAAVTPESDMIYPYTYIFKDNSIVSAGEKGLVCYDAGRTEKWREVYDDLLDITTAGGKYIVLALDASGDGRSTRLISLNLNGQKVFDIGLAGRLPGLRSFGATTAVFGDREVYFVSSSGKVISRYTSNAAVSDVWFINGMQAVIVVRGAIHVIDL